MDGIDERTRELIRTRILGKIKEIRSFPPFVVGPTSATCRIGSISVTLLTISSTSGAGTISPPVLSPVTDSARVVNSYACFSSGVMASKRLNAPFTSARTASRACSFLSTGSSLATWGLLMLDRIGIMSFATLSSFSSSAAMDSP